MTVVGRDYRGKDGHFYTCSYYRKRGSTICRNSLLIEQDVLDQIVLKAIADALNEETLKIAVEQALERLRTGLRLKLNRGTAIERELSLIEAHEGNLVDAIANGQPSAPLLERLNKEEARKKELIEELEFLRNASEVYDLNDARLKRDLRARVLDAKSLLGRHVPQARQMLRKLIDKPFQCEALTDGNRRWYRVTGQGSYLPLLPSLATSPFVASPTGFSLHWSRTHYCSRSMFLL